MIFLKYLQLSRIYHDIDLKDTYQEVYLRRKNGEGTFSLPLFITDSTTAETMQLFVVTTRENYILTQEIYARLKDLEVLIRELPAAAIKGHILNYILVDEMVMTNAIEGVHSSRKDILDAVAGNTKGHPAKMRFQNQVAQYLKIFQGISLDLSSAQALRHLYDEFLTDEILLEDENDLPDGKIFRAGPVDVVKETGRVIHQGIMPEAAIITAVDALLGFLNRTEYPILLRAAIGHYYFGYIHPFYNGNGRINRLITSYLLAEEFNRLVALRLSVVLHEQVKQYYSAFEAVNNRLNKGDATPFFNMFLEIVKKSVDDLLDDLRNKKQMLDYASHIIMQQENLTANEQNALFVMQQAKIFSDKSLGIHGLCKNLEVGRAKMQTILNHLEEKGYIKVDKRQKGYKYILVKDFLA